MGTRRNIKKDCKRANLKKTLIKRKKRHLHDEKGSTHRIFFKLFFEGGGGTYFCPLSLAGARDFLPPLY